MRGKVRVTRSLSTLTLTCQIQRSVFAQYRFPFDRNELCGLCSTYIALSYNGFIKSPTLLSDCGSTKTTCEDRKEGFQGKGWWYNTCQEEGYEIDGKAITEEKKGG